MSWRRSRLQLDVRLCRVLLACCSWPLAVLSSGNYNYPTRRITPECSLGQDPAHLTSIQHWPISFKDEDRENGFATVLLGGTVLRLRGAGKAKKTSVSDSATKDGKRRVNATAPNSSPDIAERAVMNAWRKGAEEAVQMLERGDEDKEIEFGAPEAPTSSRSSSDPDSTHEDGQPGEVDSTDDEEHPNPYAYFTRAPLADAALEQEIIELLRDCRAASLIRTGANEVTKCINRNLAEFIVIAADCVPVEMVLHLPMLCEDKGVPWVWLSRREAIGNAVSRPATAAAARERADSNINPRTQLLVTDQPALARRLRDMRVRVDNLPLQKGMEDSPFEDGDSGENGGAGQGIRGTSVEQTGGEIAKRKRAKSPDKSVKEDGHEADKKKKHKSEHNDFPSLSPTLRSGVVKEGTKDDRKQARGFSGSKEGYRTKKRKKT